MDLQLQDKCALVTGATSGTGVVIAQTLAREGAKIVVHGRDNDRAEEVARQIRAAGGTASIVLGDLSSTEEANQIARQAIEAFGGVDILINNAGLIGHYETWDDADDDAWAQMYDGVVIVIVRMVRALSAHFKERGWGRVINISSAQSGQPFAMMPDYAAAKCAIHNLSVSLSKYFDRTGVTVNTISPGIIVTDFIRQRLTEAAQKAGRSTTWADVEQHTLTTELNNPTGRLAKPEDVAHAVAFLSSPLAGYINGTNLRVDGGSNQTINP